MSQITSFLKFIFHFSILLLILLSLYPGSLLGYLFYGDLNEQPNLINNPFGTTINHFIIYLYVSLLGFFLYLKSENFKKVVFVLLFLSIALEILQIIVPNRSFQFEDLIGNLFGVLVAYCLLKIYLFIRKI